MAIFLSGGQVVSTSPDSMSSPWAWDGDGTHPYADFFRSAGYHQLYSGQPHVFTVVSKLAELQSMLPLKVYRKTSDGRDEAPTSALGRLMAQPTRSMSVYKWREHVASMFQIFGESFCLKVRDDRGDLVELMPLHPTRMRFGPAEGGKPRPFGALATDAERSSGNLWWYRVDGGQEFHVWRRELFIWSTFNPNSHTRGLSKLEPLRDNLENSKAAQAAIEALWKQGGKPSFVLSAPGNFGNSPRAVQRLADQWQRNHGGVAKWHKPLILEEGLTPHALAVDDNLQYLDARKATKAEVAEVFKLNPAAIGDLERATFNNITEILRDVGRSTLPPILTSFESAFQFDVVDGRHDSDDLTEYPRSNYVEHNLDGIMRGDYEARADAHNKSILMGWQSPAEVRELENRPFIEGSDKLLVNAAMIPLDEAARDTKSRASAADDDGSTSTPEPTPSGLSRDEFAAVMGRLSRPESLTEIDFQKLVGGLSPDSTHLVASALADAESVATLRARIKEMRTNAEN